MQKNRKGNKPAASADSAAPKEIHKGMKLPSMDHVARHVPWTRLRKDEDDNVLGLLPQVFQLRPDEPGLSVNWLEYYPGDHKARIHAVVNNLRANLDIRPKSAFGIGNVSVLEKCCNGNGASVRIVYAPTKGIPSHALIRDMSQDDLALLSLIAEDVFKEIVHNKDIP
jgi:hypothetical protein